LRGGLTIGMEGDDKDTDDVGSGLILEVFGFGFGFGFDLDLDKDDCDDGVFFDDTFFSSPVTSVRLRLVRRVVEIFETGECASSIFTSITTSGTTSLAAPGPNK